MVNADRPQRLGTSADIKKVADGDSHIRTHGNRSAGERIVGAGGGAAGDHEQEADNQGAHGYLRAQDSSAPGSAPIAEVPNRAHEQWHQRFRKYRGQWS